MNYAWVASEVMVGGVVVTDLSLSTAANNGRKRTESNHSKQAQFAAALSRILEVNAEAQAQFELFQKDRRESYERSGSSRKEILAEIRGDLDRSLAQAHDYVGLLRQIRQHIQAVLERHFPGVPPHESAQRLANEGAIYFASELMFEKLDSTKYLRNPALIYGDQSTFNLHQFLSKYIKIYQGLAKQRNIDLFTGGESYGKVRYFSDPIGATFQALLDNAIKYSPASTKVDVIFEEGPTSIKVVIASLGPRIEPSELPSVFREGFRAAGAVRMDETGMGLGLATARLVSDELRLNLRADQDPDQDSRYPSYFSTRFSLEFRKV